jgi:hypothetical protein
MFEQDDRPVTRRQLFRGLAGNLGRALGDLANPALELERLVSGAAPPRLPLEEFVLDPEAQEAAMRELFGYLDGQKADEEAKEPEAGVETEPGQDLEPHRE